VKSLSDMKTLLYSQGHLDLIEELKFQIPECYREILDFEENKDNIMNG
jgi:hypothetical protein